MRLWTLQHEDVLTIVRERGVFHADGRRIDWDFREAYAWMRSQMKTRISGAKGCPLIWAWHTPKPDLRRAGHLYTGTPSVRIELEIPDGRVLLSDFDGWYARLCRYYLPTSNADDEAHYRRERALIKRLVAENPTVPKRELVHRCDEEFRDEVESSWHRMFDLDRMSRAFQVGAVRGPWTQATFEYFMEDEIRRVTRFVAR